MRPFSQAGPGTFSAASAELKEAQAGPEEQRVPPRC